MKFSKRNIIWHVLAIIIVLTASFGLTGCKKLVEIDPPIGEIIGNEIYQTNTNAASVLTGIYSDMSNYGIFSGTSSISLKTGLSSDELVPNTDPSDFLNIVYRNALSNNGDQLFWTGLYGFIFRTNAAIEGLTASTGLTDEVKNQLLGEAKFLRAFYYFYLVNLYGDVPVITTTDIKVNSVAPRINKDSVYDFIVHDLVSAYSLINESYVSADAVSLTTERLRPNKSVVSALLSRVYLYLEQWEFAELESTKLISGNNYLLESPENVFIKTSREAIWQLQPVNFSLNTLDARAFVLAGGQGVPEGNSPYERPVYLSGHILNEFEMDDLRKQNWTSSVTVNGTLYPYVNKYKVWMYDEPVAEYLIVFRLAEQYLIRAEARARQGKITGIGSAAEDVDFIRNRAGLPATNASNEHMMLEVITKERKLELFTEWGHRWLDLKRTGQIDTVMQSVATDKGISWIPTQALYPLPVLDIQRNPSLMGNQNPGYPEQ
jgi:starch-binding outer membrane protein, SusD/RagB family